MKKLLLFIALISIAITQAQIINIPDANFKNALLNHNPVIDTNDDGEIQVSEASDFLGYLDVSQRYIGSLIGIEAFTNISELRCYGNNLSFLNIANNTNLTSLYCSNNQLGSLDVSNNTNLTSLYCRENQLNSLDVSNNTNLTSLDCSLNQLNSIDVYNNTNLTSLHCRENQLSSLDVSNNINLTSLSCNFNQLVSLDVYNNTNLTSLDCRHNQLNSIDVSNNTNLISLECSDNQLNSIDVSNNTTLTDLWCSLNQLNSIDVSNNINLNRLWCASNLLSSIDISNNTNLTFLFCSNNQLTNLDISNNTNLTNLFCAFNQLTNLDVSNNTNLTDLSCSNNQLSSLDISNNLKYLYCGSNQFINLDISNNTSLIYIFCENNLLNSLDVSNNTELTEVRCNNNPNLTQINLKNGSNNNLYLLGCDFQDLPNLQNVCVDELNTDLTAYIVTQTGHAVTFTEYCSFEPAQSNTINGTVNIDIDNNGCDTNDVSLNNVLITADNGTESFGTFVLTDASYAMFTNEGDFTTAVTTNLPDYWSATPTEYTNNFTDFDNTFTADFCITPNQTVNDVNITLIPTSQARPGFDTRYKLVYKNVGTTQLNGSISLDFNDTMLSFLNASETVATQTANNLTFNYTNLNPFETRTIGLEFNVNAPTAAQPVNIGDILNFSATINPIAGDYTTDDNIFTLDQIVVGSYDPNDITCLEGDEILLANADKYLHYVIRFQNKGTASAINIVVANDLDAKLDWSTLQLESSSHTNRVAIKNGNEIEFIFENINLPDENTDEPGSHGFIAYKIKPKADIALGDIIPNQADIFFDYNEAVPTNTATTTIVDVSAVNNNMLLSFSVYPTPTENILNINSKTEIVNISIFSKLGQLIKETTENKVDISNLIQGLYFVKVTAANGNSGVKKIVKK